MAKLTARQKTFVAEYLVSLNATQAAIKSGYSKRTANEQGSRLLANVSVAAAIQVAMEKRAQRTGIDQDRVLGWIEETVERCRNVKLVADKNGKPLMLPTDEVCPICEGAKTLDIGEAIPRDCPGCDATGKLLRAAVVAFEPYAVLKGAELAGKHLKMFTDKVEFTADDDLLKVLAAGRQRAAAHAG
jgi:phage terminase small subunit